METASAQASRLESVSSRGRRHFVTPAVTMSEQFDGKEADFKSEIEAFPAAVAKI
jgi:hypothetical protein